MREGVLFIRQWRSDAADFSIAVQFLQRHRHSWIAAGAGTILLAGVGAFETGDTAPWILFPYWAFLIFGGVLITAVAQDALEARPMFATNMLKKGLALLAVVTLVMTPLVWATAALAMHGSWRFARMVEMIPQVLLVTPILVALQLFMSRRQATEDIQTPASARLPSELQARLPGKLLGAQLHAVEAQDHYLRFHTDLGSTLVLMRLGDAMAELRALDGMQTHRSWWVARLAVVNASRGRGRATLELKSGVRVPVSRTYAPALRKAGWF